MHQGYGSCSYLTVTTVTAMYFIYGLNTRRHLASLGDFNKMNM